MEIKPLFFDRGTNEIREAQPGDTLNLPVNAIVEEYVTLFQDTLINTCCALIEYTAIPVVSTTVPNFLYRKLPYVDCIILESGLEGQRVKAALTHGKNYLTTEAITLITEDILYLGQNGKLTLTKPTLLNGDRYQVEVGRLVNGNEFIFDPKTPVDFTQGSGTGGDLPPISGHSNEWLFTDGNNILWKKLTASDILPAFAITGFSCLSGPLELGQNIANPNFSASYSFAPFSCRIKDSVLNSYTSISSPFTSFQSPGSFSSQSQTSVTFTLEARDIDNVIKTSTSNLSWLPRKFWGTGLSNTTIEQLQNSSLSSSRSQTFTITANSNEYIFLAIPSSFGTPTFYVGGFEGGFNLLQSNISKTNQYGVTTLYNLWRSDNHSLGNTTVTIS